MVYNQSNKPSGNGSAKILNEEALSIILKLLQHQGKNFCNCDKQPSQFVS